MEESINTVYQALRNIYDPELGVDIVSLGLIYKVYPEDNQIIIDMTLTTPGCPVSENLPSFAEQAAASALAPYGLSCKVNIVWDPPWSLDMMEEETIRYLGLRR